jgi:hypothetical protein
MYHVNAQRPVFPLAEISRARAANTRDHPSDAFENRLPHAPNTANEIARPTLVVARLNEYPADVATNIGGPLPGRRKYIDGNVDTALARAVC